MSAPAERLAKDLRPFVPGEVDDYGFTLLEFRLFFRVARRGKDGCFDSLATLANAFHVTERTITRTYRVLVFCGAVVRTDHPGAYFPRPFCEWAPAKDLDKIREEVWGKKPKRRTRRRRILALVPATENPATGDTSRLQSDRPRCPDRPSLVSGSGKTPGSDEGTPIPEGISIEGVEAHTPGFLNSSDQKTKPKRREDPLAIRLYRQICRRAANYYQRQQITSTVTDIELWEATLRQFMLEGQSPHRTDWLLERYRNAVGADDAAMDLGLASDTSSRDPDQPMKTVQERLMGMGLLPRKTASAQIDHSALIAPEKPVDYFEQQAAESRRPPSVISEREADQILRGRVYVQTGRFPPDTATHDQMLQMIQSAPGATGCHAIG